MRKTLFTLLLALAFGPAAFGQASSPNWDKVRTAVTLDATSDSILVSGQGYGTVGFQISGTWVGTIQFSGSINGTNWVGVTGYNAASRAGDSTTTENGVYFVGTSGLRYVKAKFNAYTSGSATVNAITTDDIAVLTSGGSASGGGGGAEGTVDLTGVNGTAPATGNGTASSGTLRVAIASNNTAFTVNAAQATASSLNAEVQGDAAHDAAASGNPVLAGAYASATAPSAVSADGDAVRLWADLNGRLMIGDGGGSLTVDASSWPLPTGAATAANQSTGNTSLGTIAGAVKNEDAAHSSTDAGIPAWAVRSDADASLASATGDYTPLQVDANGYLKVNIKAGAGSGGTSATDDAAFTVASGSGTPIMGMLDDTSPDAVDEGDVGVARMTGSRALHVNLRDASGNELSVGSQYAEDAAAADANQLMGAGTVRRDSPASSAGSDGDWATANTDADGRLWVNAGQVAHDAAVAGRPVHTAGVATSSEQTAVASGDVVYSSHTITGKQIIQPYATRPNFWRYAAATGGLVNTTGVTARSAPAAGSRNCITSVQIINTNASTSTEVEIRDGAAGTVMWRGWAQAGGGGVSTNFPIPLCGTNTTLTEIAEVTATATNGVLVNLQGYVSAD